MSMTITEMKAQAYDLLAQIQFLQQELMKLNDAIMNYSENKDDEQQTS